MFLSREPRFVRALYLFADLENGVDADLSDVGTPLARWFATACSRTAPLRSP
jgi:hypothetical protein